MTTSITSTGALLDEARVLKKREIFNSSATTKTNTITAASSTMLGVSPFQAVSAVKEQELKHAAMETPIYTLLNLWVARYGNEWVDLEEIKNDDFFALAHRRLAQMGQLEQHYLTDRARFVCRKPE